MAEITIRPYRAGDEAGLLAGHNRIFPQRSLAHWQWKFRDNPTGHVQVVLAEHERDGIVGAYVTLPVHYTIDGQRRVVGQCVDLWVLPEHRRAGARPGLFVNLGLAHYERFGGKGDDRCAFQHGWPIATWRIGQKYLRYEMVRDWDLLFRELPANGLPPRTTSSTLRVQRVTRYGADADALWADSSRGCRLAAIRDARYLNWRYADAHDQTYELLECREGDGGRLRGIAVLTHRDLVMPNTFFVVDWVVPADDADATTALVAHAERRAGEVKANALVTLFQHRDPRFLGFQRLGFLVYGTTYFQVVIPFDVDDTPLFKEHWYHTLGDADFV
jgi:hypothetical protein